MDLEKEIFELKRNPVKGAYVWVIKVDNIAIKIGKKMVWSKIGHAKSALRHRFYYNRGTAYDDLIASGRIEFVPISIE
jgi:hypothetical protein